MFSVADVADHPFLSLLKMIGKEVSYTIPVIAALPVFVTVMATSSYSITSMGGSR
jgi:hypothetical protein